MSDIFEKWSTELAQFISDTLYEFWTHSTEEMKQFAVDCHPWNGIIALAFLTAKEVKESPFLSEAREMAAWKYYDFASALSSSNIELGLQTRILYEQERVANTEVVHEFFLGCAKAVASKSVQDVLSKYVLSDDFKITIPHPDTGKEYYPNS